MPPVHRLNIYQRLLAANLIAAGIHRDLVQDHFNVNQGTLYRAVPAAMIAAVKAERLERDYPVIDTTRPRSGQPPRKDSNLLVAAVRRAPPGTSMTSIARELGVAHTTLIRAVKRAERQQPQRTSERAQQDQLKQALTQVRRQFAVPPAYREELRQHKSSSKKKPARSRTAPAPPIQLQSAAIALTPLLTIPLQAANPALKTTEPTSGMRPSELWRGFLQLNEKMYASFCDANHPYHQLEQLWQRYELQQETPARLAKDPQGFINKRAHEVFSHLSHAPHREIHLVVDPQAKAVVGEIWLSCRAGESSMAIVPAQLLAPDLQERGMQASFALATERLVETRRQRETTAPPTHKPWRLPPLKPLAAK